MTAVPASPTTLLGLTDAVPPGNTAIVVPEQKLEISYAALRDNVTALAENLAAAGVQKGDRIGMAMPNGLACVVSFLASSMAGTSAPLNPGYKDEEFQFYLDDT
ncbi:MAG TPA: AMP-binding protein, partial [Vicinamibacterales bacterium]